MGRFSNLRLSRLEPVRTGLPAAQQATVLFDFHPTRSITEDVVGGIALTDPVGGVKSVRVNGHVAAEFDGTNYLLGASSPFAALSDLTGGVSIYVISEDTGTTNTNGMVAALYQNGAANSVNTIRLYRPQAGTGLQYFTAASQDATNSDNDPSYLQADPNIVRQCSAHITTTERGCAQGVPPLAVSVDTTSIDPSSLDRTLIGAGPWAGVPNVGSFGFKGRIYRILVCEGAFDQSIADYLSNLYVPRRLPPMVDPADVAFLWDPRHCMYRDTLSGINLTPASAPTRVSRAGDVGVFFDAVDDELRGPLVLGELGGDTTIYLVVESQAAGSQYFATLEDEGNANFDNASVGVNNASGAFVTRRETNLATDTDFSGAAVALGKIEQVTGAMTAAAVEALVSGAGNGSTAGTKSPDNVDVVVLGSALDGGAFGNGYVYYALIVNAARDSTVEDWLNANFPVGTSP